MTIPIIPMKCCVPHIRSNVVIRSRLIERLNEGLLRRLTLVSAPAGFGKTTLVSEWLVRCGLPAAWLSLDEGDNDPACFITYLVSALQSVSVNMGRGLDRLLLSPQLPALESMIRSLLSEIAGLTDHFVLVLDDYHILQSRPIDEALALLLEYMPTQMHLVILTREDPAVPIARLRVRNQLTELRSADLRFTSAEAAEFLCQVMGLAITPEDVALLESRTEGWVAGLQLAALSMAGLEDPSAFIQSFTGSHHYVADYLLEEVLLRQPERIQTFLLRTAVLERLCGPLCDAVLHGESGQQILEELEHANLFIIPLDNERRWYRYHHLFADLLRQRLARRGGASEIHIRASEWYEANHYAVEAFQHAAAAHDVERAERLMEGEGLPLLFRGAVAPVLHWLQSLSPEVLDSRPSLWVTYASALLMRGQTSSVVLKLQAAEQALQGAAPDDKTLDTIGHIASIRATLAVSQHRADTIIAESRRALDYLHPDNLPVRTATAWTLGYAYQLQHNRAAAGKAYAEALSTSQQIGHVMISVMASLGLGNIQEAENQLHAAAEAYRQVLIMAGDPPLPAACEAHLGLARISYEWNDLNAAMLHGQQSMDLAQRLEQTDRAVAGEIMLARILLARGEVSEAAARIAQAEYSAKQQQFVKLMPDITDLTVLVLLRQGKLTAAAEVAQKNERYASEARVCLARGDINTAQAILDPLLLQAEEKNLKDERLKVMLLLALVLQTQGNNGKAARVLEAALTMAEPGCYIRSFVDEGLPMQRLLREVAAPGLLQDYQGKLLAVFEAEGVIRQGSTYEMEPDQGFLRPDSLLIEPLSLRELEVLRLIAEGLSNREISERLYLALPTVKGYNRMIFDKLQVRRRTEAVANARKLGLL